MVRSEFHEKMKQKLQKNAKETGELEQIIAEQYVTEALIRKEKAKLENELGEWNSKYIGRLLGTLWHCVIEEEIWNILKKYKNPTIDFKKLQYSVITRIKTLIPDLFN